MLKPAPKAVEGPTPAAGQKPSPSAAQKASSAAGATAVSSSPVPKEAAKEAPAKKPKANPLLCRGEDARKCGVSKQDFKKAAKLYEEAVRLKKTEPEQALDDFEAASKLEPRNVIYAAAQEMMRQQRVYDHTRSGNELASEKRNLEAMEEFRKVLELDPGNPSAVQQLHILARAPVPVLPSFVEPEGDQEVVLLHPRSGQQPLILNGDIRSVCEQIGKAFGIKITFDEPVRPRQVNLSFTHASFGQAMNAVALVTNSFWMPVSTNEILVALDTPAKHKELDHWVLRTFYLPEVSSPQDLTDIVGLLRTIFELRLITQSNASQTITVRGPAPLIEAATLFLQSFWAGKPQVTLDIDIYEVSRQMIHTFGMQLPLQLTMQNIPQAALAALGSNNIQNLLSQVESGGLSSLNSSTVNTLLSELQQQSSLFSQPVATFGGGSTLMGIPISPGTLNFSDSKSWVMELQKASLRAEQGDEATLRVGSRYPVMNASYSSMSNVPTQLAGLLGSSATSNTNTLATFPSFTFEDLGLTIKAKPTIHRGGAVTIELDLQLTSLGSEALNGVPVINNRSYKGVITVQDAEPAIIAGALSQTEQRSLSGIPGFSRIPLLSDLTSNRNNEHDDDELLLLITPHIVSAGPGRHGPVIPLPHNEP